MRAGIAGREINPTVYTPADFKGKLASSDPFLKRALDKPRLVVLGNKDGRGKVLRITG
jgi:hypothetical protein